MPRLVLALVVSACWRSGPPPPIDEPRPRPRVSVEPPEPPPAVDAAVPIDADPGCTRTRVLSGQIVPNNELELIVGAGADHGVTPTWSVTLAGPTRSRARIVRVDPHVTRVAVTGLTLDMVARTPTVELCP